MQELKLKIENNRPAIASVIEAFAEFTEKSGIPMSVAMQVNLIFDELLTNIISYAFPDNDVREIGIHVNKNDQQIGVQIVDDGVPFNPFEQSEVDTSLSIDKREIGGLGIHLVKNVMDEFTYERRGECNIVSLTKRFNN